MRLRCRTWTAGQAIGTYELLRSAALSRASDTDLRARFRFVHVSTDEVYGSLAAECRFHETTPYAQPIPHSAQGRLRPSCLCRSRGAKRPSACGGDLNIVDLQRLRPQFREKDATPIGDVADCAGCCDRRHWLPIWRPPSWISCGNWLRVMAAGLPASIIWRVRASVG
jgi:GDP-mannose 4,6 dehydratase